MKIYRWITGIILLSACAGEQGMAQGPSGYLVGTGIMWYQGDLSEKNDWFYSRTSFIKPLFRLALTRRIFKNSELALSFIHGQVAADDSRARELDNILRNQSFKSSINELSVYAEFYIKDLNRRPLFNPFVFVGAGVFRFNPKAELNGVWYELQPLGTEGQNITEINSSGPYSLTSLTFPAGIGLAFHLNDQWRLRLDVTYHKTMTDYLDDVSTVYADSALLAASPYGQLTVALANRRLEPFYPFAGRSRGNPKMKDSFMHIGLSVVFNPGVAGGGRGNRTFLGIFKSKRKILNQCPDT